MALPSLDWSLVMMETRWEKTWLHRSEINNEGLIQRVPEPVDWDLLGPVNLQRLHDNKQLLFVELPSALGYFKFTFLNEQLGIKVYQHCSDKYPYVLLVREVPGTLIVNVRCISKNGGVEVKCSSAMSGELLQTHWYDIDHMTTIADLRRDFRHEAMVSHGQSIHTTVKFMRAGTTTALRANTLIWSSVWLARRVRNPIRRRIFGKQATMVQSRLDKYFNFVQAGLIQPRVSDYSFGDSDDLLFGLSTYDR
jgi:hypothetical protein